MSYLRVSTEEQAEKDLSIPAQRRAVENYARHHGTLIDAEYVEPGCSGRSEHRPVFHRLFEDAIAPNSTIGVIVVHHTSRFTRDATEARVVKRHLGKSGVHVVSVSQETDDGPAGQLLEGILECFDQYESEVNGVRTSAAMREAVRQGYFPGAAPPYGYAAKAVRTDSGVARRVLVPDDREAEVVRALFRCYVGADGAKSVARELNARGYRYRHDRPWSKDLVLRVLEDEVSVGQYHWGRHATRDRIEQPRSEWLSLAVEPIVDRAVFELANRLRTEHQAARGPRGASSPPHLLSGGMLRCGKCGASYQLETSGKRVDGTTYRYCYYNCRTACRIGKEACAGHRLPTIDVDRAVLAHLADAACTPERTLALQRNLRISAGVDELLRAWRALIMGDLLVGRSYVRHLIDRIVVYENRLVIEPRRTG